MSQSFYILPLLKSYCPKTKQSSSQQFPKPSCSFAFQANITVQRHRSSLVFAFWHHSSSIQREWQLCKDRPAVGNMIAAKRSNKSPDITELYVEGRREIIYPTLTLCKMSRHNQEVDFVFQHATSHPVCLCFL